jgi:multicomponent Na+:H+ antiporter subunit D
VTLMAGCVAFGVFPTTIASRVAGPSAAILLHPDQYAAAALGATPHLPVVPLATAYGNPADWITTAMEVVLGMLLAGAVLRAGPIRPLEWLRRLHTGSLNDYAAFSAVGLIASAAVLLAHAR